MSKRIRRPATTSDALPPDIKALAAAVEAEKKRRAEACLQEVKAVLKRHNCQILSQLVITGVEINSSWGVSPRDQAPSD